MNDLVKNLIAFGVFLVLVALGVMVILWGFS